MFQFINNDKTNSILTPTFWNTDSTGVIYITKTFGITPFSITDLQKLSQTLDSKFINFLPNGTKITNTLASNLRFLRINTQVEEPITTKIRFMSQRQLAEFMGSATQQVSKFELGTNIMSSYQIYKVSKIFDISLDKLFDAQLVKSDYKKTIKQDIYCL